MPLKLFQTIYWITENKTASSIQSWKENKLKYMFYFLISFTDTQSVESKTRTWGRNSNPSANEAPSQQDGCVAHVPLCQPGPHSVPPAPAPGSNGTRWHLGLSRLPADHRTHGKASSYRRDSGNSYKSMCPIYGEVTGLDADTQTDRQTFISTPK